MEDLTPQQEKKIRKIVKVVDEGNIAIVEHLFELEEKFDEVVKDIKRTAPDLNKILETIKGQDYIITEDDKREIAEGAVGLINTEKIVESAVSLIDTDKIAQEIRGSIPVESLAQQIADRAVKNIKIPVVEKVIEKTETIREIPIVTNEVKEVAVADTGEEVVAKINDLPTDDDEKKIGKEHIRGLEEELESIKKNSGGNKYYGGSGIKGVVAGDDMVVDNTKPNYPVIYAKRLIELPISPPTVGMATGDSQQCFVVDAQYNGWKLVSPNASVFTASTSGLPTFQIRNATQGYDILSTAITIDVSEKDSTTATTPPVVDTSKNTLTTGDQIMIDVDVAGGSATGDIVRFVIQPA